MSIEFHGVRLTRVFDAWRVEAALEPEEAALIRDIVRRNDRVILAGGGFGWLAVVTALIVGPDNLLVLEPQAYLAEALRYNIKVDGIRLRITHAALAAEDGVARLWEHPYWPASSLVRRSAEHGGFRATPTKRLDELIAGERATVAVLDIEGLEYDVLTVEAARALRAVIVEVHDAYLAEAGKDGREINRRLREAGLTIMSETPRADGQGRYVAAVRP